MSKPKLTYFDFSGSRGEECRLALFVAGVDFEDDRIPRGSWPEFKASTPFGGLPVLEVEGKGRLAESNAILTFVGRRHGMHPEDAWESARHEALMSATEHLRHELVKSLRLEEGEDKKAAREALAKGPLTRFAKGVEAELGDGPFVAGEQLNVVDLKLRTILRAFVTGSIDHVPATVFADYPRLMRLYEAVDTHPKVVEWSTH